MRRRAVLRGVVGLAGVAGAAGATAGDSSATGSGVAQPTGQDAYAPAGQDAYAPLGRVELPGAAEAVVDDAGDTAYVATTDGFATVDVRDPAGLSVLAERTDLLADHESGPMAGIQDVSVDGDRLLVAGPANEDDPPAGVVVYDVADPADPRQVGYHETRHAVHNCYLDGDVAYLTAGDRLRVADVAGDDPAALAGWGPTDHEADWVSVAERNRTVHDVYVHDGVAYVATWDAGTFLLDVAAPADPVYLARVADYSREEAGDLGQWAHVVPPGNHHYARVSDDGSLLAVGRESWALEEADGGGPGGITLYDLSTPSDPTELATIDPVRTRNEGYRDGTWTTSHNFDLVGDRLYSSWYQAGVKIHDVSDPASPELLAWWRQPDDAAFWTAQHAGDAVVASSHAVRTLPAGVEGLYAFPDEAGEQADPPTIPSPTPTPTPSPTPASGATETATAAPGTATPSDAATVRPARTTGDGVGLLGALAALGGAAWWRRRESQR